MKKITLLFFSLLSNICFGQFTFQKSYGNPTNASLDEYGYSIKQTSDRNYVIAGYTKAFGAGDNDVYLFKIDSTGNLLWTKTFGGPYDDKAYNMYVTSDSGFIIGGYARGQNGSYITTDF
jgi:hypothetical protein